MSQEFTQEVLQLCVGRELVKRNNGLERLLRVVQSFSGLPDYNPTAEILLSALIDFENRKAEGKEPRITGSFEIYSGVDTLADPRDNIVFFDDATAFLSRVFTEFMAQAALESAFIEKHVTNNDELDIAAKRFMMTTVTCTHGPWLVKNFVQEVHKQKNRIVVSTEFGESYYYLP